MLAADRDALICDLAETYRVLDYRALPVELLATLAAGLRPDARIWQKIAALREEQEKEASGFDTAEAFEAARAKLLKG